jgi:opacity protein-like surface antigen
MKFSRPAPLAVLIAAISAHAGSWTDDDSWKTSSPYYYGDSEPAAKGDSRASARSERRMRKSGRRSVTPFAPDSNNLALDIGQNFLIGSDFQDAIGLQATYTYGVSPLFAFATSMGYSSHSEGKYSKLAILAGPRLNLSSYDSITPYVNAGLGFYRASRSVNQDNNLSGTLFGLHFGGGADLQLTKETFFGASLTFHQLFGTQQDTSIGPVDVASNYADFMAHIGYTF